MQFSENLKRALNALSQEIAADLEGDDASNPEIVAEIVIDANRLSMAGYKAEDNEVSQLIKEHGYEAVLLEAAKHVATY